MPDPTATQFWLLAGATPTGPFTAAQIRQQFAAGEVTAGTRV